MPRHAGNQTRQARAHTILDARSPADAALVDRLCDFAAAVGGALDGTAHVTITIVPQCEPWITVSTHPDAELLERIERSRGGPAHDAMWYNRVTLIPTTLHDRNWPEYSLQCQRQRIGSVAAFPIEVDGERRGVLTVASINYFAFAGKEIRIGLNASRHVGRILRSMASEPDRI